MQSLVIRIVAMWLVVVAVSSIANAQSPQVDYSRDITPILSQHCYACHGPDEKARQANLRLDDLTNVIQPHASKSLIRPGAPEGSHLWQRLIAEPEQRMPPAEHGARLTKQQLTTIHDWISQGAEFSTHWAFRAPRRPPLPDVKNKKWAKNEIDLFILHKLQSVRLHPSEQAFATTLLRRLALDTTGLPPTLEEQSKFHQEERSWKAWVDYYLDQPAFGEHQANDWLDAARYADTTGHAADKPRPMWLFRDWVINAINDNMPYDQFTIEQLAGDMLDEPTVSQLIATGFHRNSMQALGNNPRKEEFRVKGIIDRLETTGKVWLGLTVGCAECHDHKYDPLTQKEYYQLYAIFNNVPHLGERFDVHGPRIQVLPPATQQRIDKLRTQVASLESKLQTPAANVTAQQAIKDLQHWLSDPTRLTALQKPAFQLAELTLDGSKAYLVPMQQTPNLTGSLSIGMWIKTTQTEVDLVSKYDWKSQRRSYVFGIGGQSDPGSKPGTLYAWLSENQHPFRGPIIYGSTAVNDGKWHHIALRFEAGKSIQLYVDGKLDSAAEMTGEMIASIAHSPLPLAIGGGFDNADQPNKFFLDGQIKDLRLFDRPLNGIQLGAITRQQSNELHQAIEQSEFTREVAEYYQQLQESIPDELTKQITSLRTEISRLEKQTLEAQVMAELPTPRETYIHIRGDFENPGPAVEPGIPAVIARTENHQPTRLTFARSLFDKENALVARVAVNRIWQHYFGRGIVATVDDFGLQGEYPSHPGLLDWLAVEFRESGWNVKHIHRLILQSAVYQQASIKNRAAETPDPENRWLSYAPRIRMNAEQIRDLAVFASGKMNQELGGPSVFPEQPEGTGQYRDETAGQWVNSPEPDQYRRSLYTYWQRMSPYPLFILLDAPSRERCTTQRLKTNTPLQALALMNDPHLHRFTEDIARRLSAYSDEPVEQVLLAFQLILSRSPDRQELKRFEAYLATSHPDRLFQFIQILLNLDEALTRE